MDKLKNIRILPPNNIETKVETKLHYFDTDVKDFLYKQRMVGSVITEIKLIHKVNKILNQL